MPQNVHTISVATASEAGTWADACVADSAAMTSEMAMSGMFKRLFMVPLVEDSFPQFDVYWI